MKKKNKKITSIKRVYRKKSKEIIGELESQLDNVHNKLLETTKTVAELEQVLQRNIEYTQQLELEIATTRETKLNLIEAINVLSRAERLRVQEKLWSIPSPKQIEATMNTYEEKPLRNQRNKINEEYL